MSLSFQITAFKVDFFLNYKFQIFVDTILSFVKEETWAFNMQTREEKVEEI